ncbi:hypothetical protein [Aestuariivirga sp.]|uniref:hypothetical protein n=1 Tax=Aestuariivirga sp. TaxID=2650926 RepID=UPI0039E6301C
MKKSLIAAAALTAVVAGVSATSAQAGKVHVDIGVGGWGPGYPVYAPYPAYEPYPVYVEPDYYPERRWGVSCGEAKWQVRSAHFRNVRALDCSGRVFSFTGWKHGDQYRIRVSRRDGDIISVSAIY